MPVKVGRIGPLVEPRCGPQAGKSGDPHSQNADSSPRAQGALGLGLAAKRKGKCGAPRAPTACDLGRRVAVDWTWASPLPDAASATAQFDESLLHAEKDHYYLRSWRPVVGFPLATNGERGRSPCHPSLPLLLPLLLLPRFTAGSDTHGACEEALDCGEGKGLPGGAWLPSTQTRRRSSPQAPRNSCNGSPWSRQWSFAW